MKLKLLIISTFISVSLNLFGIKGPQIISPSRKTPVVTTLDPTFTWKPISKPGITYEIKIAENQDFTIHVIQIKTANTAIQLGLPYFVKDRSYYWTVRAVYKENGNLIETNWAHEDKKDKDFFKFTVMANAHGFVGYHPVFKAPDQNKTLSTLQPEFRWDYPNHSEAKFMVKNVQNLWVSPKLENITYSLEISTFKDFSRDIKTFLIKSDSLKFTLTIPWLKRGTTYFYRIKATYHDPEKNIIKDSDWAGSDIDPQSPCYFSVASDATGKFSFNEGLKEEVVDKSNLKGVEMLTNGSFNSFSPSVTKDGQKLSFCSDRNGKLEIYELNISDRITGSGTQKTTSNTGKLSLNPFWLPNNTDVVFYSNRITDAYWHLFNTTKGKGVVIRAGDIEMEENRNDFELFGSCSTDGKIVYTTKMKNSTTYDLYLLDLNTNTKTQLLPGMFPDIRNDDRITYSFNPDSKDTFNYEIMVGTLEGGGIVDPNWITDDPACDYDPAFSPDGARIAFTSTRSGNSDIWIMDTDGSNLSQITYHPMVDRRPQWINNETIVFQSNRINEKGENFFQIYRMKVPKTNN